MENVVQLLGGLRKIVEKTADEFEPGVLDCTTTPMSPRCLPEVTVPEDSYLVMGDHRSVSADSAYGCRGLSDSDDGCWLWARDEDVVGRASAILWPVSRWSGL